MHIKQGDRSSPLRMVYQPFGSPSTGSKLPGLRIELGAPVTPVFMEPLYGSHARADIFEQNHGNHTA